MAPGAPPHVGGYNVCGMFGLAASTLQFLNALLMRVWDGLRMVTFNRLLLPHPNPLPKEREPMEVPLRKPRDIVFSEDRSSILRLPGGEGRGKGKQNHRLIQSFFHPVACTVTTQRSATAFLVAVRPEPIVRAGQRFAARPEGRRVAGGPISPRPIARWPPSPVARRH